MYPTAADVGLVADTNLADLDDNLVAFPFGHLNWLWFLSAHDSIILYLSSLSTGFFSFF